MSYISSSDITDSIARDFVNGSDTRVSTWLDRCDDNLEALALSLGTPVDSIYTPLNWQVKEYCIAFFCFQLFQDAFGENAPEINDNDIYKIKLEWYKNRVDQLRPTITKEMLEQVITSLDPVNMVQVGVLYRA